MDLAVLSVERGLARQKFAEYRRLKKQERLAEDEMIMRGYREIVRGRQVIDIVATIKAGGVVEKKPRDRREPIVLPRLAVMRADVTHCHVSVGREGDVVFYKNHAGPKARETRHVVSLPTGTIPGPSRWRLNFWENWRAMVPHVPPALRPADSLGNYHILFEAEWEQYRPPAPKDPALLKHIGGDLYAVIAVWDLSELERTVLAMYR